MCAHLTKKQVRTAGHTRSSSLFCLLELCYSRQCVQMAERETQIWEGAYLPLVSSGITFNTSACPPFAGFSQNLLFPLLQPHTPSTDLIYISPPESAVQFFEWRQPGARLKTMLKCYYNLFILMLYV